MSLNNPFLWAQNPRPSIFAEDDKFTPRSNGLTVSLTSSVVATRNVARETKRTGRNPGTLNLKRSQPVDDAWARKSGVR